MNSPGLINGVKFFMFFDRIPEKNKRQNISFKFIAKV